MKTKINLTPFLNFVQRDWTLPEIIEDLERLYFNYTRVVMERSEKNDTAIAKDEIDDIFIIKKLLEIFKNTEIKA